MKATSFVRVDMKTISAAMLRQWAECYCEIWKEAPWNEDFWRPESVAEDFIRLMQRSNAVAFLAVQDGSIAGFTLGYSVTPEELRTVAGNSLLDGIFGSHERVFYIGELGVAQRYRGQRMSITLTSSLIRTARAAGLEAIVLRTHTQAHVARHVYEKLAFVDLGIHDAAHPDRTYWLSYTAKLRDWAMFRE